MEELTCPNCNVDADPEELKRNFLRCPTCGFDLSDTQPDDLMKASDWEDEEEGEDFDEDKEKKDEAK
jgi:hypothetical protein